MTETFYILKNFPEDIMQEIIKQWYTGDWKSIKETVPEKMWHYCLSNDHPLMALFPEKNSIEYYYTSVGAYNTPHLDRGRWSAINFPIEVDFENSYFHCGKYFWLGRYTPKDMSNLASTYSHKSQLNGPTGFFDFENDKFVTYNLEHPVVFSTKVPHGGNNKSGLFDRVICSIGFQDTTYEELLNKLPPEWF